MTPQQLVRNSKSWEDFEARVAKLPPKQRGTAFEWLCVFYLQVEPRYKTTYKRVLHSSEYLRDNNIKKKLGLIHNEQGTDIIGETYEGKLDIIQCKYKDDKTKNITAKDLDASVRIASGIEARKWVDTILICSNLKGFTKNKTLDALDIQFRTVAEGDFKQLTNKDFANIKRVIDNKIPKYESKTPRKHQKRAVNYIVKHYSKNKRGQIVHACGTGKTLTSYFAFRELKPKLTLFAVPSLQLINQTLLEWTKESLADNSPISPFVVCSDKSNEKIGECDPALWMQELGIKVSNKKEDLEAFLKSKRKNKVIFSTYQSGKVLANNMKALNRSIDFAFFDEAHNTATSKGKLSSHLLFDKNISIKQRLFMTATPKKLVGRDDRIASMEDESIYGELIDEITVKEAIEGIGGLKLLNDYQIITQIVDCESYLELLADNPFVVDKEHLPEEVELKLLSSAITLKKLRKKKRIKNIVSFHGRRNRANAFRKGARQIDKKLNTFYVDGKQSGTERQNILEDFANNPPSLVTNAQCLSEGVNVPSIDAIMFVDPKQSKVDITQAIGRALRKGSKDKGTSYIIIPIIVDKDNPENIEEAYQQILMVLRSMSEHDGRIVEYFRLVREGKKPPKSFVEVNSEYLPEHFDLKDFTEKLHFRAWDRVSRLGRRPFEQARLWARTQGFSGIKEWNAFSKTVDRPPDIPADPYRAYSREWTSWPDFLGNPTEEEDFERFMDEYKKYAIGKFDPIPPNLYELRDGYKLGVRVRSVIGSYQRGSLPKWKLKRVENELIKPGLLNWYGRDAFAWDRAYEAYKEYLEGGGKPMPIRGFIYKKINLEIWVQNQKLKYKILKGVSKKRNVKPLTERQFILLKKIKFPFADYKEETWNKKFFEAKKVLIKYKGKIPDNKDLYQVKSWVSKQRNAFKRNRLSDEQIRALDALRYWSWDPLKDQRNNNLKLIEEYVKKYDTTQISQALKYKGVGIGIFLTKLRAEYRAGNLDDDSIKRLKNIKVRLTPTRKQGSVLFYD